MVYKSDFTRRQFLNSCAESGLFHSSPDYKPQGFLSSHRLPSTGSLSTITSGSRSERTAKLLASLGTTTQHFGAQNWQQPTRLRQSFDPDYPYSSSEAGSVSTGNERILNNPAPTSCCACHHHHCGGRQSSGHFTPEPTSNPFGDSALRTQHGMESYLKSRRPNLENDELLQLKPKSTYSVRSIPVRSLDELREAVAIRRNYVKERQKMFHGSEGALSLPSLTSREYSVSPQPDGSFVMYPPDEDTEKEEVISQPMLSGGRYHEEE